MWVDVALNVHGCAVTASVAALTPEDCDRVASQLAWHASHLAMATPQSAPSGWDAFFQSLLDSHIRVALSGPHLHDLGEQGRNQLLAEALSAFLQVNTLYQRLALYLQAFAGEGQGGARAS